MSLLAKGKALRDRLMPQVADPGGTLTWIRKDDAQNPVDVTGSAWLGRTVFTRLPNVAGASIVFGDADALILFGAIAEPDKGDRLVWTNEAGTVVTYEVISPQGEPAWRWSDPERTLYRVHLKEVV